MMRSKKILVFLTPIVLTCSSIAQSNKNNSSGNNYRLVTWTANEGLSVDHGNVMLKDINGFLWIGSPHGLNRFDGSNFKHYFSDKNKHGTLCGNYINNLIEDSLHNIWVGTEKGLSRYDIKADTFMNFLPAVHAAHTS